MLEENQTFRFPFAFSQADVVQFAQVTGDNNPLHLDASYAAGTVFKQPIIHGFLGGSVFSRVFGTLFPGEGTIYLKQSMEFVRPMLVGTEYEAVFTVKEINREKHQAVVSTEIFDKSRGKLAVKGEATVMNAGKI
jgi:acyl dehydratase